MLSRAALNFGRSPGRILGLGTQQRLSYPLAVLPRRGTAHLAKVSYTATGTSSGLGRSGEVSVPEADLRLKLGVPGRGASGVNPEQLLAAGWSACFFSSLQLGAKRAGLALPPDLKIEVDIHLGTPDTGKLFGFAADIYALTEESDKEHVKQLLLLAEGICPYSQTIKDNIVVTLHPEGRPNAAQ